MLKTHSEEAKLYLIESIEISDGLESVELSAFCQLCVGHYELSHEQYRKALSAYLTCTRQFFALQERQYFPECLEALALSLANLDCYSVATALFGGAHAVRLSLHMPLPPVDEQAMSSAVRTCRLALGAVPFESIYAEGQQLSLDDLLAVASTSELDRSLGLN
jgi:hypothetical protein